MKVAWYYANLKVSVAAGPGDGAGLEQVLAVAEIARKRLLDLGEGVIVGASSPMAMVRCDTCSCYFSAPANGPYVCPTKGCTGGR